MNQLDKQSLKVYTAKAQADKAINSLKGILLGINMDGLVNEVECNELKKWATNHNELISRNPFNEFIQIIEQTTSNGLPSKDTIEDLFWLCQKYESDNYYYNAVSADLQTLQGICHGVLSDGVINEEEVFNLDKWLDKNEHLSTFYPYDEIRALVLSIVSDKKVDEDEKLVLKAYFSQFVNLNDSATQAAIRKEVENIHVTGFCTSEPEVSFEGSTFCITGDLKRCNRSELQKDIEKLGGAYSDRITAKTDYLIIGGMGSPAWAFSCYGRKVEKALEMRKKGHQIMLIQECDFADIIDDLK